MNQPAGANGTGPHQRKMKNFLLDAHLQLRYAAYLVVIAMTVSVAFGAALWITNDNLYRTSQEAVAVGQQSVKAGSQSVKAGELAIRENKKVNEVVKMNIVEDPIYKDNPELLEAFQADARMKDAQLLEQQRDLEASASELNSNARRLVVNALDLEEQMRRQAWIVAGGMFGFVIMIGLAGIVVTHKIAGPLFKIRRHFRDLGDDNLEMPSDLRKGDELVDFFRTFQDTVGKLRGRAEEDIATLSTAISELSGVVEDEQLEPLKKIRARLEASLRLPQD